IDRIVEIRDAVMDTERALYGEETEVLVQGHGDLHPGNVLIGQDDPADPESHFAAVIDFTSSRAMPPAFDVGAFIEQFQYQFFQKPEITAKVSADDFLTAYLAEAEDLPDDFLSQVQLFKVRTTLRIMAYLIGLGMGQHPDMWRLMVEAERNLAHLDSIGFLVRNHGGIAAAAESGQR
ncbi:MAG: phosphotransferase, partial [Candidatus Hydrogenedentes bacterium]|nr:phosphotransferase [Candidatus Hydrogenedentota bacterium]